MHRGRPIRARYAHAKGKARCVWVIRSTHLPVARGTPTQNQIAFLISPCAFRVVTVRVDVGCPIPARTLFLLMVAKAVSQVGRLSDVNRRPVSRPRLLGEDVITWAGVEGRIDGIDPVLVLSTRLPRPLDGHFHSSRHINLCCEKVTKRGLRLQNVLAEIDGRTARPLNFALRYRGVPLRPLQPRPAGTGRGASPCLGSDTTRYSGTLPWLPQILVLRQEGRKSAKRCSARREAPGKHRLKMGSNFCIDSSTQRRHFARCWVPVTLRAPMLDHAGRWTSSRVTHA
jgi:hypothetical protein